MGLKRGPWFWVTQVLSIRTAAARDFPSEGGTSVPPVASGGRQQLAGRFCLGLPQQILHALSPRPQGSLPRCLPGQDPASQKELSPPALWLDWAAQGDGPTLHLWLQDEVGMSPVRPGGQDSPQGQETRAALFFGSRRELFISKCHTPGCLGPGNASSILKGNSVTQNLLRELEESGQIKE